MKEYESVKIQYKIENAKSKYELQSETRKRIYLSLIELLDTYPYLINKNIIIFGAGSCVDLPMDYICDMFSEVVLVDINSTALENAKQYIPSKDMNKVSFVAFDVTGLRTTFFDEFLKRNPSSIDEILEFIKDMANSIPVLSLPLEISAKAPFSLTISDLVISQLTTFPLIKLIYPYILKNIDANYDRFNLMKFDEINNYASEMAFQHLKLMYDITQKVTGKILVLSDVFVYSTEENILEFNDIMKDNPQYLADPEKISRAKVMQWLDKYALPGGNISIPIRNHNFTKIDHTIQRWWWKHISKRNRYFVLEYILTPKI